MARCRGRCARGMQCGPDDPEIRLRECTLRIFHLPLRLGGALLLQSGTRGASGHRALGEAYE